jgi:hypothetical protein
MASAFLGERLARRANNLRPPLEAACGERDVGRHRDVARPDTLGNPVVRRIRAIRHHDAADEGTFGQPHPGIRDEMDDETMPLGDAHGLVLDWAGVGVDVEDGEWDLGAGHSATLAGSAAGVRFRP